MLIISKLQDATKKLNKLENIFCIKSHICVVLFILLSSVYRGGELGVFFQYWDRTHYVVI